MADGVAGVQELSLVALEPAVVAPYEGFTLVLSGRNLAPGVKVRIEGSTAGRYLSYQPSAVEQEHCEVEMALGFGPRPSSRRVYLEGTDGARSETLVLSIRDPEPVIDEKVDPALGEEHSDTDVEPEPRAQDMEPVGEPTLLPEIVELSPSPLAAGRAAVVEVYGENFTEDSAVWVRVNVNAGSSRLPEYELRAFDTVFVDSGLLEVEFDRGFYPVPGARDIVVENSEGVRSAPAVLTIQREDRR